MTDPNKRPPLPRQLRYPQPPKPPKHLDPVTAELRKMPTQPRHAKQERLPTNMIPKITSERDTYPPREVEWHEPTPDHSMVWLWIGGAVALVLVIIAALVVGAHI